jgi:hypothetical protein
VTAIEPVFRYGQKHGVDVIGLHVVTPVEEGPSLGCCH